MSEFENQNEDSFSMVRANRDCHPKGERVVLASESQCRDLIRGKKQAERDSRTNLQRAEAAEARVRAWHVITVISAVASAGAGVLIGLMM